MKREKNSFLSSSASVCVIRGGTSSTSGSPEVTLPLSAPSVILPPPGTRGRAARCSRSCSRSPSSGSSCTASASSCSSPAAAAVWLSHRRSRREGLDPEVVSDLAAWLLFGGLIGARALFLIQNPGVIEGIADVFKFWQGGIIFYGCILGGLVGTGLFYLRRAAFPFLATADAVAPSLALGIALGRLGCFLNGCCYGDRCNLPWAVRFPTESLALAPARRGRLDRPRGGLFAPGPPEAALPGARRPRPLRPADGLLPEASARRRGHHAADDRLSDLPLPHRVLPRRRDRPVRRSDDLAVYQPGLDWGRPRRLAALAESALASLEDDDRCRPARRTRQGRARRSRLRNGADSSRRGPASMDTNLSPGLRRQCPRERRG